MINSIGDFTMNYQPKILYILVNKNTTHRLFENGNGHGIYVNPGPGTVLDTGLVENSGDKLFDFYLIPHKATIATARPVHYKVVWNSASMAKEAIENITYHLCYNYVNFAGSIKVPAPCMYAQKLANYAHDNSVNPNPKLALNLHYL